MRRRKALSVRVRNPSRGLVTRLPAEEADEMGSNDKHRVFVDAKNVRFEDGCVAASPGYLKVNLSSTMLTGLVSHWRMNELQGETRADSGPAGNPLIDVASEVTAATGLLGNGAHFDVASYPATLEAASNTSLRLHYPFTISGWVRFDTSLGTATILHKGTDYTITYGAGFMHVILNDGAMVHTLDSTEAIVLDTWYFIVVTLSSTTLSIRVNETTDSMAYSFGVHTSTDPLIFNEPDDPDHHWTADSFSIWSRVLSTDELDLLYNTGDGLDYPFFASGPITLIQQGDLIDDTTPKPLTVAAGGNLYALTRSYAPADGVFTAVLDEIFAGTTPSSEALGWSAVDFYDKEIYAQRDNVVQYWKPSFSASRDLPGLTNDVDDKWDGVESFFGHVLLWRDDIIKWSATNDFSLWIPVAQTAGSFAMTVDSDFVQPALGGSVVIETVEDPTTEGVVVGQYITIADIQGGLTYYNYYRVTAITSGSITGTLQDFTGATTPGLTVASLNIILSVNANEAGQTQNVGSRVNGPIYQILAQGDYAYIFKERSIQSIQYVGLSSGVFFMHPEIANEGLIARKALLGLGDGRMVFVGHREIYQYRGGPTLEPIMPQFTRQFYEELDRGRVDEILLFHKEFRNEVWVQYPVFGGTKVLIWNYAEDTITIDIYSPTLGGFTALADVEWPVDPSWDSLADSTTWESFDPGLSWDDMAASGGADRFTLAATGDGELLLHGVGFSRDGDYTCLAETQDFDGGEPDIFKYVDVILVGLQVKTPDTTTRLVYVQLGYRDWLDSAIKWTAAIPIQVQGGQTPPPLRLNPGGAGRFLRLRFYSVDANVPWRITSYEIHCRPGSYY